METIKHIHLTHDCLMAVADLRTRYDDVLSLKGEAFDRVYYKALMSFVTKDNPIKMRYGFNDPVSGKQIIAFDQPIPFVNIPRQ